MKKIVKKLVALSGYKIVNINSEQKAIAARRMNSMHAALERLGKLIAPCSIIDVGAASGHWTELAMEVWPNAMYNLIEPLQEQDSNLHKLKNKHHRINIHRGVAGEKNGEILFSVSDDLDGSGVYGNDAGNVRPVPVFGIDQIVEERNGPFLIKLDTHGYELPILKGAENILKVTDALVIEVYGFQISPTALLFHQLSTYLETKGFLLYDLVDVTRRKTDSAFWQADAVYLKNSNSVFATTNFD